MYKVMQVLTDTNIGGAGTWLLNFLKAYDREKIETVVVLPENSMLQPMVEKLSVRVVCAKNIGDKSFSVNGIGEIIKIIKSEKPHVIHTHASLCARIAAKLCGVKTVNTRHCLEEKKRFPLSLVAAAANRFLSSIIIAVSKATEENLIESGIPKKKIRLVYNGVWALNEISAEKKAQLRENYGIGRGDTVIGIVARMEPVKRHDVFLNAAKIVLETCENVKFLIVGDGSMRADAERLAADLGIEKNVIFAGYIENVNNIVNIIDINVLTSEKEALSISLIEGMSIGKPAVAINSGGPGEVIENGKSGILIESLDSMALAKAISELLKDKEKMRRMGERGRIIAEEKFGADKMADSLLQIYISLAERSRENG